MKNSQHDIVIIGGGHNGLIAAAYLAKGGLKPLVLERRDHIGGAATTSEICPGFRCSTLAHAAGPIRPEILEDLELERHGVRFLQGPVQLFAPALDGSSVAVFRDASRTTDVMRTSAPGDGDRYADFQQTLIELGRLLDQILTTTPPSIDHPSLDDAWRLLNVGRRFRHLNRRNAYRLLRWTTMPVADVAAEWFERDLLKAVVAADGIFGTYLGPRSGGTGAVLLLKAAARATNAHDGASFVQGGMGALSQALAGAAREAGAEIRTGVEVVGIEVERGAIAGVRLSNGDLVSAKRVVSNLDPKRTFLELIEPMHLGPDFVTKIRNYRCVGATAKVNLALDGLPTFTALQSSNSPAARSHLDPKELLAGRIHIGPHVDYLERAFDAAKYGDFSNEPYLDITIPSIRDSSLAPAGKHVMSVCVQYAPYRLGRGTWEERRFELGDTVVKTLAAYAPDLPKLVVQGQVITPLDLENDYGLTGGHIYHGELALDQLFTMRPVLGWAQYRAPIRGLYLCGSGTHPGTGLTGVCGRNASREILKDVRRESK